MSTSPAARLLPREDGGPLDQDRVLALGTRWGDRPLSLEHLEVGRTASPADGVAVRWEGTLPVFALADGLKGWVERAPGQWVDAGRRVGLEVGEVLVLEAGGVSVEARLLRRSERLVTTRKHENVFFGLVTAHTVMIAAAFTAMLVLTPHTDDESIWGQGGGWLRVVATPWAPVPKKQEVPQLTSKVNAATQRDAVAVAQPKAPTTARDALRLLLGGGGAGGLLVGKLGGGIDAALDALGGGNGGVAGPADGLGGMGPRGGPGQGGGGLPGGGIGPLGVNVPGGPLGLPGGLKKRVEVECPQCEVRHEGYDRDLILKVVRRHQSEIRYCYEAELTKEPSLAGKVAVAWVIDPSGHVASAEISESGLENAAVERCILDRVRRWSFPEPKSGEEVTVTFPWLFQVAGGE